MLSKYFHFIIFLKCFRNDRSTRVNFKLASIEKWYEPLSIMDQYLISSAEMNKSDFLNEGKVLTLHSDFISNIRRFKLHTSLKYPSGRLQNKKQRNQTPNAEIADNNISLRRVWTLIHKQRRRINIDEAMERVNWKYIYEPLLFIFLHYVDISRTRPMHVIMC